MSDRVVAVLLLLVVIAFGVQAWSYVPTGFTDILGARLFPLAIAGFMVPLTVILYIEGHPAKEWPGSRAWLVLAIAVVSLVVFALVIEYLGFILAAAGVFIVFGLLFHARWWQSLIAGVIGATALYTLFVWALDLYLPVGELIEGWL